MAERRAQATWEGSLTEGSGRVELDSGVTGALPVSWAARTEAPNGKTSPEELIAGAHAACFSMALSGELDRAGRPPERLEVAARATFDKRHEGWRIGAVHLEVRGTVPGIDASSFEKHADAAKDSCPVSNALKNNVVITLKATLA
jgi:lipoyl-dependent peroxiredoxin